LFNLFFAISRRIRFLEDFHVETYIADRSELRSEAHALNPVVMIAEAGLTPTVLKKSTPVLNRTASSRFVSSATIVKPGVAMYENYLRKLICFSHSTYRAKLLIIYRPKPEAGVERTITSGRGMREVTIVKPSAAAPNGHRLLKSWSRE